MPSHSPECCLGSFGEEFHGQVLSREHSLTIHTPSRHRLLQPGEPFLCILCTALTLQQHHPYSSWGREGGRMGFKGLLREEAKVKAQYNEVLCM